MNTAQAIIDTLNDLPAAAKEGMRLVFVSPDGTKFIGRADVSQCNVENGEIKFFIEEASK